MTNTHTEAMRLADEIERAACEYGHANTLNNEYDNTSQVKRTLRDLRAAINRLRDLASSTMAEGEAVAWSPEVIKLLERWERIADDREGAGPENNGRAWARRECAAELRGLLNAAFAHSPEAVKHYCPEKMKPGGCSLHNLHCGYPKCDQPPAPQANQEAQ